MNHTEHRNQFNEKCCQCISEVIHSIDAFLKYGQDEYLKSQMGYFSCGGFAADTLIIYKIHLESKLNVLD